MDLMTNRNGPSLSPDSLFTPIWKPDLYRLQQEAPKPHAVPCSKIVPDRPPHLGSEFHGDISHSEASRLLTQEGHYLVRLSKSTTPTLSLFFRGRIQHFKLYFSNGQYYVGSKKYDTLFNLVADGLVTLHIEAEAGPYLNLYDKSPAYLTLNRLKQHTLARNHKQLNVNGVTLYDKPHNFKTYNFKGLNWCEFCGHFLWGFVAQGVKCEDCGFAAHSKCGEKLPADCCPEMKELRSVFGVDLTALVRARRTTRPFVVDKCIHEIEVRGLNTEGLYRVSGFADEMDSLRLALERDGEHTDMSAAVYDNINVIAGILKLYFRLLPIPLLTYELHADLVLAIQKYDGQVFVPQNKDIASKIESCLRMRSVQNLSLLLDEENQLQMPGAVEQIRAMKEVLSRLPPAHYNTLKFLMSHLHRVMENQEINKMNAQNLSTVFAPTLMPKPDTKLSGAIPDMTAEISTLALLIQHQKSIFQS